MNKERIDLWATVVFNYLCGRTFDVKRISIHSEKLKDLRVELPFVSGLTVRINPNSCSNEPTRWNSHENLDQLYGVEPINTMQLLRAVNALEKNNPNDLIVMADLDFMEIDGISLIIDNNQITGFTGEDVIVDTDIEIVCQRYPLFNGERFDLYSIQQELHRGGFMLKSEENDTINNEHDNELIRTIQTFQVGDVKALINLDDTAHSRTCSLSFA